MDLVECALWLHDHGTGDIVPSGFAFVSWTYLVSGYLVVVDFRETEAVALVTGSVQ